MISEQLFQQILDISKKGILLDKQLIRRLVRDIISATDFRTKKDISILILEMKIFFAVKLI